MRSDEATENQLRKFHFLWRAGTIRSGNHYAPGFLYGNCGVYSTWQQQRFFDALESNKLAYYDKDSDSFYVV
jgi:hypothetical protein